jgi:hypothetical protein
MASENDLPPPPPGGFLRDPGPAGPSSGEQKPHERIVDALESVREELRAIRQLRERQGGGA